MRRFSFNREMNLEVTATFIGKGDDAPLTGPEYRLRLYDKDIFGDDYLGESTLNEAGKGRIVFGEKAFGNTFSLEKLPDFYFVLYRRQVPIFKSQLMHNVDIKKLEAYQQGEGEVIDLGIYLVASQQEDDQLLTP